MATKRPAKTRSEALLYAASEMNADMLYFGGVFVPDAFVAFSCKGSRIAVVSQLEFARVRKEGRFDEVLSLEDLMEELRAQGRGSLSYPASLIACLGRKYKIRSFRISQDFPAGPAFRLRELGRS